MNRRDFLAATTSSLPLISLFREVAEAQSIPVSVGPWMPLFNGRNFDGWDYFQEGVGTTDKTNAAVVHDGTIHMLGPTHTGETGQASVTWRRSVSTRTITYASSTDSESGALSLDSSPSATPAFCTTCSRSETGCGRTVSSFNLRRVTSAMRSASIHGVGLGRIREGRRPGHSSRR